MQFINKILFKITMFRFLSTDCDLTGNKELKNDSHIFNY